MHPMVFKMDNQEGAIVWCMEFCSVLMSLLGWERSLRENGYINVCKCMAELLCCPPETIITLLIGYTQI